MAIRINNTTVIDDSRNAVNIPSLTFSDGTVQRTAAPVFGDTVTAGGSLLWTLDNPNAYSTSDSDDFGRAVSISGNYAIVGAANEDDSSGPDSGKVYVYNVTTGQLTHTINNPNAYGTPQSDVFGHSAALSGNYAIVGAYQEDDAGGTQSGKAYIFNVTTGQLVWTLNNPSAYSTSFFDLYGFSVAISGNYAIVGAYYEADPGGTQSGKAYIYNVTTGQLVWTLNNPSAYSASAGDWLGSSVAISDNFAIVAAKNEDDSGGTGSGKAYIFNVTTGALVWTLNNPNAFSTSLNDQFGHSVAISGNFAIVSSLNEDDGLGTESGKAYIFNVTTGQLLWTLNNPNAYGTSVNDNFGWSVGISGNYAIVGASNEDSAGGTNSGKAYIFNVTTGQLVWTLNNPNAYSTESFDSFGQFASISGNYVIVAALGEKDPQSTLGFTSGKAYIFNIEPTRNSNYVEEIQFTNGTTLNLLADKAFQTAHPGGALIHVLNNPNAYSTTTDDYFGENVAISGNYVIVNAYGEDDAGGASSGKAYIYNVTTGALVHTLNNPNAYSTSLNDRFGQTGVDISGNYAIVSAHDEDAADGSSSGKAYIFNVTTGQLVHVLNNPNAYSTGQNDYFSYEAVAISDNYAIVGAFGEDAAEGLSSGKAYIFNVTTGQLVWTLNDPNAYGTGASDQFGLNVAISGNYALVAAREDDVGGFYSGRVYIFNVGSGQLVHSLQNPNAYSTSDSDYFGFSVAISGNFAIIGAAYEDDTGGLDSGKAYIYNVTTGALVHTLNNPNAYGTSFEDLFGWTVAISGNYAIVGAFFEDDSGGTLSGKAYIYNVTTGTLLYTLNNPNAYSTSANDAFGIGIGISNNYIIAGAPNEADAAGTYSGKAYIFSTQNLTYLDKILTVAESIF